MFQPSFTGSSRRQRQVNLSGRTPANPFTAGGSIAGAQAAIASAQQDRVERQQQRQRLQACGRIQRVWRGHNDRRQAHKAWRDVWDAVERDQHGAYPSLDVSLTQMNRLMLFFSPTTDAGDVQRLSRYGTRQIATATASATPQDPWPGAYGRLRQACLEALQSQGQRDDENGSILDILAYCTSRSSSFDGKAATRYYRTLMSLHGVPERALTDALLAPLQRFPSAYSGLAILLQRPVDSPMLELLQSTIHPGTLAGAVARMPHEEALSRRDRIWLLGNLIGLCGSSGHATTTAIAPLLGSLADEIDFEGSPIDLDDATYDQEVLQKITARVPLSTSLQRQFNSLVSQERVRNLLAQDVKAADAQLYASYALTLLRCFPRQADDIRMWLYLGSTGQATTTVYFWEAMKSSKLVSDIVTDSRSVLSLLQASQDSSMRESWTVVLMFLELYTFLLKIMDDEEFMGRTSGRQRQSAIPIGDVAYLVTFLKNLGFTLTFNSTELQVGVRRDAKPVTLGGLPGISWG
ncbi:ubiquitin-protein ligase (E3), partial [Oleoguttula sp. CCFEE 5521]